MYKLFPYIYAWIKKSGICSCIKFWDRRELFELK